MLIKKHAVILILLLLSFNLPIILGPKKLTDGNYFRMPQSKEITPRQFFSEEQVQQFFTKRSQNYWSQNQEKKDSDQQNDQQYLETIFNHLGVSFEYNDQLSGHSEEKELLKKVKEFDELCVTSMVTVNSSITQTMFYIYIPTVKKATQSYWDRAAQLEKQNKQAEQKATSRSCWSSCLSLFNKKSANDE